MNGLMIGIFKIFLVNILWNSCIHWKVYRKRRKRLKSYEQDVDELKSQMNTMKHKLAALEQTRNSEVASMEDQLGRVRKRIQELEFDDSTKSSSIIHET